MNFENLFLEKTNKKPLYQQLYLYLAGRIQSGGVAAGQRLPGKRSAAEQLGISVNTVDEAYQMLAAEGYVVAKPRSGFVVAKLEQTIPPPKAAPPVPPAAEAPQRPVEFSFSTGDIDPSLFPRKMWNRLLRETLAGGENLFTRGKSMGEDALRLAIAEYLKGYRGVRCTPGQIVVGAGLEVLVGMLARLFAGQPIAVESPGYGKTSRILQNMGGRVCPVAVDDEGVSVSALQQSGAQIAYLTPSHQFPTGAVMPIGRRAEVLHWAAQNNALIIEDDYDSEFRFDGRPLPSLQGLDEKGHVVYAGTFSRSLAPGLRAAYLVLPAPLLQSWKQAYGEYTCTVSRPEQHTLAKFMQQGHFARSLNRMRGVYRQRRNLLLQALAAALPAGSYTVQNAHTGLYFVVGLPGKNAVQIANAAPAQGVRVSALRQYVLPGHTAPQKLESRLVLGYGGLANGQIEAAVQRLAHLIQTTGGLPL
ncbi:MAG: PLP-dependent aminotransferase family protein [Oscillospiraceae bacterium]